MFSHISNNRRSGDIGFIKKINSDKPIFQLTFPRDQLIGHSDIRMPKIDVETKPIYDVSETSKATDEMDNGSPRILYHSPLLTSESYGWWYDDTFSARNAKFEKEHEQPPDVQRWPLISSGSYGWWYDRDFGSRNHHDRDPECVRSNEIIHWQDQKLSGLCHQSFAGYS